MWTKDDSRVTWLWRAETQSGLWQTVKDRVFGVRPPCPVVVSGRQGRGLWGLGESRGRGYEWETGRGLWGLVVSRAYE